MSDLDPPRPTGPPPWRDRIDLLARTPQLTATRIAAGVALALVLVVGGWFVLRTPDGPPPDDLLPVAGSSGDPGATSSTTSAEPTVVVVHAAGAVVNPGVYELPSGSRVTDLIDAAGGPAPDADVDRLNLAALVVDGQRVYVPRIGEAVPADASGTSAPAGPIDLNTATLEQLDSLPGVGPATAQAIIGERERRGGFRSVDDLLDVRGIGPAKLEAIRDLVTV